MLILHSATLISRDRMQKEALYHAYHIEKKIDAHSDIMHNFASFCVRRNCANGIQNSHALLNRLLIEEEELQDCLIIFSRNLCQKLLAHDKRERDTINEQLNVLKCTAGNACSRYKNNAAFCADTTKKHIASMLDHHKKEGDKKKNVLCQNLDALCEQITSACQQDQAQINAMQQSWQKRLHEFKKTVDKDVTAFTSKVAQVPLLFDISDGRALLINYENHLFEQIDSLEKLLSDEEERLEQIANEAWVKQGDEYDVLDAYVADFSDDVIEQLRFSAYKRLLDEQIEELPGIIKQLRQKIAMQLYDTADRTAYKIEHNGFALNNVLTELEVTYARSEPLTRDYLALLVQTLSDKLHALFSHDSVVLNAEKNELIKALAKVQAVITDIVQKESAQSITLAQEGGILILDAIRDAREKVMAAIQNAEQKLLGRIMRQQATINALIEKNSCDSIAALERAESDIITQNALAEAELRKSIGACRSFFKERFRKKFAAHDCLMSQQHGLIREDISRAQTESLALLNSSKRRIEEINNDFVALLFASEGRIQAVSRAATGAVLAILALGLKAAILGLRTI